MNLRLLLHDIGGLVAIALIVALLGLGFLVIEPEPDDPMPTRPGLSLVISWGPR